MKITHVIIFVMILLGIGLLVSASRDVSTYATFETARLTGDRVKIVGELAKNRDMHYNPEVDPNYFSFYLQDADGAENHVILKRPKPQDFELSEKIVLTGKMEGEAFVASDILMKCPSKYKDEEFELRAG